jgi:hypothetical protein
LQFLISHSVKHCKSWIVTEQQQYAEKCSTIANYGATLPLVPHLKESFNQDHDIIA